MSKECDVIRDLLPLYVDEACSEASAEKVRNHLAVCSDCYAVFQQMCSDTNEELLKKEKESILQRHEKKEKAKTTIKSISIVSAVLSILFLTVYIAGFINVVKVWCRESDMYSIEERKAAAEAIKENYDIPGYQWWLHSITYTTDEICKESLEYCNSFGKVYEECMVFQARLDFKDWGWNYCCRDVTMYLVKTEEGEWDVLTGSRELFLDVWDIPMKKYKKLPQK